MLGAAADRPAILVARRYAQLSRRGVDARSPRRRSRRSPSTSPAARCPPPAPGSPARPSSAVSIDGRNVWRGDLAGAWAKLEALRTLGAAAVAAGTSTSLQHVPHDVADETDLDPRLASWLAFADQKVGQVATLARGLADGRAAIADELAAASAALADRRSAPGVRDGAVRARAAALVAADFAPRRLRRRASPRRRPRSASRCCPRPRSARSRRPATSAAPGRGTAAASSSTDEYEELPPRRDRAA